jgi:type IV pilus assembly protein PilF
VRGEYDRAHFYMSRVMRVDALTAEMLWTAINIERKRGDHGAEGAYVAHLRRLYPNSQEFSAYQRGMFDE